MLAFIRFVLAHFLVDPTATYEAWRAWVSNSGLGVAALFFSPTC
ncbi:hypothetical protein WKW77_25100 [Variovorax ureilyticus]|uniref:Uncharacterized protein n=1 Tax=Variovorax ureilyticus TaxID=1836198 RepID=A0ABU8VM39_9BURK